MVNEGDGQAFLLTSALEQQHRLALGGHSSSVGVSLYDVRYLIGAGEGLSSAGLGMAIMFCSPRAAFYQLMLMTVY